MNKFLTVFFVLVFLSGCAVQTVSSNSRSVIIRAGTAQMAEAQKKADEECAKHNRIARFGTKATQYEYVFDCIE